MVWTGGKFFLLSSGNRMKGKRYWRKQKIKRTVEEDEREDRPSFLVALIDHESLVDYDTAMQLLRYMVCIWTEYRREMDCGAVSQRQDSGQ